MQFIRRIPTDCPVAHMQVFKVQGCRLRINCRAMMDNGYSITAAKSQISTMKHGRRTRTELTAFSPHSSEIPIIEVVAIQTGEGGNPYSPVYVFKNSSHLLAANPVYGSYGFFQPVIAEQATPQRSDPHFPSAVFVQCRYNVFLFIIAPNRNNLCPAVLSIHEQWIRKRPSHRQIM